MKKTLLFTILLALVSLSGQAQISLVGAATNTSTGKIDILRWTALDTASVNSYSSLLDGYFYATSAFDSYNSQYYLTGISGQNSGLYSFNTLTNEENLTGASNYTNISEFDMSTGKMYNLKMETEEYISVYEFDINTNQDSLIGVIYEPGANGIVADAIGFNANNGILYYVGFTNDPAICLYSIPVREKDFSFSRTILNTTEPFNNITSVNFDNVNEKIFALNFTFDSTFSSTGLKLVELDASTGDIITRAELSEFPYLVGGSSSFDQNTGSFLWVGIDTANVAKMVVFNTNDNTYVSGFVPDNVSEIVCDNTLFVQNNYITTGIEQASTLQFNVFPNPVSDKLTISGIMSDDLNIRLMNINSGKTWEKNIRSGNSTEIDLSSFLPGIYILKLTSDGETATRKIVVN